MEKDYCGAAMTSGFLKVLTPDVVEDSEWIYGSNNGERKCVLRATSAMSPRGEGYSHYGIKRIIPSTISNGLSDVLDQRYGGKEGKGRY